MPPKISTICISARHEDEVEYISGLIRKVAPKTNIISFDSVMEDINLLSKCNFIFICGGDGSVAYIVGKFFEKFGEDNLHKLKPIVPVIRPKSVGYLKQLDFDEKKFLRGMKRLLSKKYTILDRAVITTKIYGKEYLAVNELNLTAAPQMAKFDVYLKYGRRFKKITTTMGDAALIVTPIGSTGWALSYGGLINLAEDTLELVFAGGIHSSANFTLPRNTLKIELDLKNSSIMPETIEAYQVARKKHGLKIHENSEQTLRIVYGPRVIIDGKLIAFGITYLEIYSDNTIPFVILDSETTLDKARKLTKRQSVK